MLPWIGIPASFFGEREFPAIFFDDDVCDPHVYKNSIDMSTPPALHGVLVVK